MPFYLDTHNCETCRQAWEKMNAGSDEDDEFDMPEADSEAIKAHILSEHPGLQRTVFSPPSR